MDLQAFRYAAAAQTDNNLYGAIYGLDDVGQIQAAVLVRADVVDNCLYVDNLFNVSLKDQGLLERLREEKERLKAKKVKIIKIESLGVGD
jgi:hypothetical protein